MTHTDLIPSRRGWLALSPMIVFLTLYVAVSAMIGDFYKMPIAVALTAASAWGIGVVMRGSLSAVSYTHLTLPTTSRV